MRSALLTMEGNENHASCLTTRASPGVRLASEVAFSPALATMNRCRVGRLIQGGGVSAGQGGEWLSGHRGRLMCEIVAA